jgi:ABC-type transport system involved in cytochrome bd biosynthesis fused ATPase/permease subunit
LRRFPHRFGAAHVVDESTSGNHYPEKQVKFTLTIDLVTAIVSGFLLFFLMGYFDAVHDKTGATTPPIVYLVYIFLGLVSAWQMLSFTVGTTYRKKLNAAKRTLDQTDARPPLPEADERNVVANSITEQTTRTLDKVPRR